MPVPHHREFLGRRRRPIHGAAFAETLIEGLAAFDAPMLVYLGLRTDKTERIGWGSIPISARHSTPDRPGLWTRCQFWAAPSTSPNSDSAHAIKIGCPSPLSRLSAMTTCEGVAGGACINCIPTARIWLSHDSRGRRSSALCAPRILPPRQPALW